MKRFLRRLIVLLLLLAAATGGYVYYSYEQFLRTPLAPGGADRVYDVKPGTSLRALAADLHRLGWFAVPHPIYFEWLARTTGLAASIKAGEYQIAPTTRPRQLLQKFASSQVKQHRLTIIEGWTFARLLQELAQHPALATQLEGVDHAFIMRRIGSPYTHPEGWFLPDTYAFPRGTSDVEFLRRAHRAMRDYLDAQWPQREPGLPLDNPLQALTLASIVEKETGLAQERARIAGVFVQRLRKKMRLQTDPTVIYGLGDSFDGDIRYRDLRRDTPYNTYTRGGLPPTPIALPGRDAIHAALHPELSDALYFVARGDGSHQFSATLQEHNKAVAKYQLKR